MQNQNPEQPARDNIDKQLLACGWLTKQIILFSLVALSINSCIINRQRQVWLTELKDAHAADKDAVVRIYLDKRGEFYPDNIYIPYKAFFKFKNRKSTFKLKETTGNLKSYFTTSLTASNDLATAYHLPPNPVNTTQLFNQVQKLILTGTASKINYLLSAGKSKILIIMIHGFNDPNPTGDYQRMRDYIKNYKLINDAVYLEVYWDGLNANQGNPGISKIWAFAQLNSEYEANTIRSILNSTNPDTHFRIITHSLGASIGTGALFNTYSKSNDPTKHDYYTQMILVHAPQQQDIRIGMIAPAIPGVETFTNFNIRDGTNNISIDKNNISHVVIGYKEADNALIKGYFQKKQYLSKLFGATTLGCNAITKGEREIDRVSDEMKALGYTNPQSIINPVDFNSTGTNFKEEHGLYYYMRNEKALKLFLDYLFD